MATLQDELIAKGLAKEMPGRSRIDTNEDSNKLTPEQIKNWREVLCHSLGPYALIAPDEQIQQWRDKLQQDVYSWGKKNNIE